MNDEPNWFIKLFKYKVCGKGHYEGDHWIPAPCYWTWKWNK